MLNLLQKQYYASFYRFLDCIASFSLCPVNDKLIPGKKTGDVGKLTVKKTVAVRRKRRRLSKTWRRSEKKALKSVSVYATPTFILTTIAPKKGYSRKQYFL